MPILPCKSFTMIIIVEFNFKHKQIEIARAQG